jgi:hypothetical protein
MSHRHSLSIFAFLLSFTPFGLLTAQPYAPIDYFPLVVGNHWRYYTINDIQLPQNERWTFSDIVGDTVFGVPGEIRSFESQRSECMFGSTDTSVIRGGFLSPSANGDMLLTAVVQGGDSLIVYDPPQVWLRNPIVVGDTLSISTPQEGFSAMLVIISFTDTLDLPCGQFTDVLVVGEYVFFNGQPNRATLIKYIAPTIVNDTLYAGVGREDFTFWETNPPSIRVGFSYLVDARVEVPSQLDRTTSVAKDFYLSQNYPNPFNATTTITFNVARAAPTTLEIFNLLGEHVATVVNGNLGAGRYRVSFNGGSLASGMYIYQLQSGAVGDSRKMLLVK